MQIINKMSEIKLVIDREDYYHLKYLLGEAKDNDQDTIEFKGHEIDIKYLEYMMEYMAENEFKAKSNDLSLEEFEEFRSNDKILYASSVKDEHNKTLKINSIGDIFVYKDDELILKTKSAEEAILLYNSLENGSSNK